MSEILESFKAYEFKGGSKPWFNVQVQPKLVSNFNCNGRHKETTQENKV